MTTLITAAKETSYDPDCFYALHIYESNVKLIRREVSAIVCGLKS